ncbi:hypothetical protein Ahy_A02g007902 isoform A [Arachis hypogaea]|uniref:Uncharacterized protein n=1 Tax=Arachis hypogaea TaxID=3818 RepID=A0A445EDD7_ARAHY|nr:hypothetical protein Ahy_A02g007902 isoform A [Arachis hypogaea]
MNVREAIERPLNGSKIIMRFNEELQAVRNGASLLSGILGALGSYYKKFSKCEKSWVKVHGKDNVYDDCIKVMTSGILLTAGHCRHRRCSTFKKIVVVESRKHFCNKWRGPGRIQGGGCMTRITNQLTLEQNLDNRLERIPREHWRWFIDYRNDPTAKAKCRQNALNRKKQLYTHTSDSKSLARARKEEIEQLDETTIILSANDSLAQALGKERSGRVRGISFGMTPSQLFRPSLQLPMDRD